MNILSLLTRRFRREKKKTKRLDTLTTTVRVVDFQCYLRSSQRNKKWLNSTIWRREQRFDWRCRIRHETATRLRRHGFIVHLHLKMHDVTNGLKRILRNNRPLHLGLSHKTKHRIHRDGWITYGNIVASSDATAKLTKRKKEKITFAASFGLIFCLFPFFSVWNIWNPME